VRREKSISPGSDREAYESQARARYALEPYIAELAAFDRSRGRRVLEIGVGLGADHQRFAEADAICSASISRSGPSRTRSSGWRRFRCRRG
jgi:hypothetical protein